MINLNSTLARTTGVGGCMRFLETFEKRIYFVMLKLSVLSCSFVFPKHVLCDNCCSAVEFVFVSLNIIALLVHFNISLMFWNNFCVNFCFF